MERIVLIHGAATTAAVWRQLTAQLGDGFEVVTPQRGYTGDWDRELDDLASVSAGAFVVGVSGGATLALGLAERGIPAKGYIVHEPAAGSLAPHLLDHVIAAMIEGGVEGFGTALYGPAWTMADAPLDESAVTRDLAMFRRYQPIAPAHPLDTMLVTVGADSPPSRHAAVAAVAALVGARVGIVPRAGHAVHLAAPREFADIVKTQVTLLTGAAPATAPIPQESTRSR